MFQTFTEDFSVQFVDCFVVAMGACVTILVNCAFLNVSLLLLFLLIPSVCNKIGRMATVVR